MKRHHALSVSVLVMGALCSFPDTAMAYIGPGAGLSAIGAFLAVIAAVVVALFGFIWYPIKRLVQKLRAVTRKEKGKDPE